ncbi:MAG: hypothetical protein U5Q44_10965 [Dehalococcoidia bacterium]|nr:hypothetical protein [Dehalococcoidia bacterium]
MPFELRNLRDLAGVVALLADHERRRGRVALFVQRRDHFDGHILALCLCRAGQVEQGDADTARADVEVAGGRLHEHVRAARQAFQADLDAFLGEVAFFDADEDGREDEDRDAPDRDLGELRTVAVALAVVLRRLCRPAFRGRPGFLRRRVFAAVGVRVRAAVGVIVAAARRREGEREHRQESKEGTFHVVPLLTGRCQRLWGRVTYALSAALRPAVPLTPA